MVKIGIISDTHGTLPAAASSALEDSAHIVHAGDIGGVQILDTLARIAPVTAVRGNMDGGDWARPLAQIETLEVAGVPLLVLHDLFRLDLDPAAAGFRVVISGHTHQSSIHRKDGVLMINPGSASHPRYGLRPSVAVLDLVSGRMSARIVEFDR